MAILKELQLQTQPSGSGVAAVPTEANHFVNLGYLNSLPAIASGTQHAPVTKTDTNSVALTLVGQLLSAAVRLKTAGLAEGQAAIGVTVDGLVIPLGTGANSVASGAALDALSGVVAGKANATHAHAISDVTGLQAALDAKANSNHTHVIGDIAGLAGVLGTFASGTHAHVISDVTGLQTALDGKAAAAHAHVISDVTGLQAALDAKAATVHSHDNATTGAAGFMSAADKVKLDSLAATEQWRPSVAAAANLPLNTDPVGTCRMARDTGAIWRCIATTGLLDDQWSPLSLGVQKFSALIGDGSALEITVAHNRGTRDVSVAVRQAATPWALVACEVTLPDENHATLSFEEAPTLEALRVTIMG